MRIIRKIKNFNQNLDEIWDAIIENGSATEDECRLVTSINGYTMRTLNDIIEARTGYHDIEQYLGEVVEDEDDFACGSKGKKKFAEGYDADWEEAENEKHSRLVAELSEKAQKKWANGQDETKVRVWLKEALKQEDNRHSNAYQDRYGY